MSGIWEYMQQFIGPFEIWDDLNMKEIVIRLSGGETYRLSLRDVQDATDPEQLASRIIDMVIGRLGDRALEASRAMMAQQRALTDFGKVMSVNARQARIQEIDKELDILRGRVPTPPGYRINMARAKKLMKERSKLTQEGIRT